MLNELASDLGPAFGIPDSGGVLVPEADSLSKRRIKACMPWSLPTLVIRLATMLASRNLAANRSSQAGEWRKAILAELNSIRKQKYVAQSTTVAEPCLHPTARDHSTPVGPALLCCMATTSFASCH